MATGGVCTKCTDRWSRFTKEGHLWSIRKRRHTREASSVSLTKKGCIISITNQEKSGPSIMDSSKRKGVPIYVMMPTNTFRIDRCGVARIRRVKALKVSLKALKLAGVRGIAVEVWWGVVERHSPFMYNWCLYEELFKLISDSGLKLHVALSFHASLQSSVNAKCCISLPLWVVEIGCLNRDIYYQDRNGLLNDDYLTLGVDQIPLFHGRTALQCYADFMTSFRKKFESLMGTVIEEVSIGLGPSGELRYPSHNSDGRWRFPGIGEFQCYDKYMMEDLKMAACQEGKPEWGHGGPGNAGSYNSFPSGVPFFEGGVESFLSDYGCFFLDWYSGRLICHADAIISVAANIFNKYHERTENPVLLVAKIGGVYWWYLSVSHAAELTAGYYNTTLRDGYDPLALMLSRHGAVLHVSCLDMIDREMPSAYLCSPESLLKQIREASGKRKIELTGRNANERLDKDGLSQIVANCYHMQEDAVRSFTFLRLTPEIFQVENWNNFTLFVEQMNNKP